MFVPFNGLLLETMILKNDKVMVKKTQQINKYLKEVKKFFFAHNREK